MQLDHKLVSRIRALVGRTLDPKFFERDSTKSSVDDLIFESGWRKFFEQLSHCELLSLSPI